MKAGWPADFPKPRPGARGVAWWIERLPGEGAIFHLSYVTDFGVPVGCFAVQKQSDWTAEEFRSWVAERVILASTTLMITTLT